jgi:hypothetical protein
MQLYSETAYLGYLFHVSKSGMFEMDLKYTLDSVGAVTVPVTVTINGKMYHADSACYISGYAERCNFEASPFDRINGMDIERDVPMLLKSGAKAGDEIIMRFANVPLRYYDNHIKISMNQQNYLDILEIDVKDCLEQTSCSANPCFEFPLKALNAGQMLSCNVPSDGANGDTVATFADSDPPMAGADTCDGGGTGVNAASRAAQCGLGDQSYCCNKCEDTAGWTSTVSEDCDYGTVCEDIDECALDAIHPNGGCTHGRTCKNMPGWFYCESCPDGGTDRGDKECKDTNECGQQKCGANRECVNYDAFGDRADCRNKGACTVKFDNGGTVYVVGEGQAAAEGQELLKTSGVGSMALEPPVGEDTATRLPIYFTPGASAEKSFPKYACLNCLPGFEAMASASGNGFEQDCTDIDECATANGGCDPKAACFNNPGGRFCGDCPMGYEGNPEVSCTEIPEEQREAAKGGGIQDEHSGKWTFMIIMVILSAGCAGGACALAFLQIIGSHGQVWKGNSVKWDSKSYKESVAS